MGLLDGRVALVRCRGPARVSDQCGPPTSSLAQNVLGALIVRLAVLRERSVRTADVVARAERLLHVPGAETPPVAWSVMSPLEGLAPSSPLAGTASADRQPVVEITASALAKLLELRDAEPDADQLGLRLEIASAPGEDFRYDLSFDEYLTAAFTDEVRTHDGLKVIIPRRDLRVAAGRDARLHRHAGARDPQPEPARRRRDRGADSRRRAVGARSTR